ncbi:hypothetical protein FC795_10120 [Clostridium botulinum]|nr:hypothetical protein [Clostridium botulinum]
MHYNKNIKNLLFNFRSDINYNCCLIMYILISFGCTNTKNSFKDYRKINLLIEFLLDDYSIDILIKFLNEKKLNDYETHVFSFLYLRSVLEGKTTNSAILLLDKKSLIKIHKTKASVNIYCDKTWIANENIKLSENIESNINKILCEKEKLYKIKYNNILKNVHEIGG